MPAESAAFAQDTGERSIIARLIPTLASVNDQLQNGNVSTSPSCVAVSILFMELHRKLMFRLANAHKRVGLASHIKEVKLCDCSGFLFLF